MMHPLRMRIGREGGLRHKRPALVWWLLGQGICRLPLALARARGVIWGLAPYDAHRALTSREGI